MGTLITSLHGRGRTTRMTTWASFDAYMVVTALVLAGFGLVTIWSADGGGPISFGDHVARQFIYLVASIPLFLGITTLDYRYVKTLAWAIYLFTLVLLVLVMVIGYSEGGSERWINLGVMTLQPSEIAKLGVIIALAAFIADRGAEMTRFVNFVLAGVIVAVPGLLVYQQPDLGTTGVFCFVWLCMMLASRTRILYLLALVAAAPPGAWIAWRYILEDYMRERLLISFDPYRDYLGAGFNIIQAQITIGSGGLLGHGLEGSAQSQLELLRVRETDFIFAHAMGMFGFVGALALFVTMLLLLWRVMRVATVTRDPFGQQVAVGVTAMLFFQMFVNVGMNIGLVPVTGIPLPFISLGGTSLWTLLASLGLLQSILIHNQRLGFQPD